MSINTPQNSPEAAYPELVQFLRSKGPNIPIGNNKTMPVDQAIANLVNDEFRNSVQAALVRKRSIMASGTPNDDQAMQTLEQLAQFESTADHRHNHANFLQQ